MHAVKLGFRALLAKDATILGGPSSVLQAPHQQSGTYITHYMRKTLLPSSCEAGLDIGASVAQQRVT